MTGTTVLSATRRRRAVRPGFGLQGWTGLVILAVLVLAGLAAPWLAPYAPDDMDLSQILAAPGPGHWFGTDELGRDMLSRVIFGARATLLVVVPAVLLALAAGVLLGLLSGQARGWVDALLMRLVDAMIAIPSLMLALAIVAALGPSLFNTMLAIALAKVAGVARLVRGEALALQNREYVVAARALGTGAVRIALRHVLPNTAGAIVIFTAVTASSALMTEAALSFLGLGVRPPEPSWGYMVSTGMQYWTHWWMSVFPGAAIFVCVLGFNLLGNGLRDTLDPNHGGSKTG